MNSNSSSDVVIQIREVSNNYKHGQVKALQNVSLDIQRGEVLSLLARAVPARALYCAALIIWNQLIAGALSSTAFH